MLFDGSGALNVCKNTQSAAASRRTATNGDGLKAVSEKLVRLFRNSVLEGKRKIIWSRSKFGDFAKL